ncbi:MAG: alanine racemase [Salinibacterium sp.]|nr:MAG: alanine racemase [Salinibacterium sp.]
MRPMREAVIDTSAISANVQTLLATIGVPAMVVVKADGYGHGALHSAHAALEGGATWLGVADVDEAFELRDAGVDAPMLAWLHDPSANFDELIAARVDIGVSYADQLERVARASGTAYVHLKVDTGLGRNGAVESTWPEFFASAVEHERAGRIIVRGLWSHLANAGHDEDHDQLASFERAREAALASGLDPEFVHLSASAGALRTPASRFNLVRLGISAYGLSPFDDSDSASLGLKPAMELSGTVAAVKRVPAGSGVSYGFDYRTPGPTTLALVPLGYADGVPRHASGRGPVAINGVEHRVSGRIAMDQFVVDVGEAEVQVGDRAVLFGDPSTGVPSADDWAEASGTINYEIVTRIGPRVRRTYRP